MLGLPSGAQQACKPFSLSSVRLSPGSLPQLSCPASLLLCFHPVGIVFYLSVYSLVF